MSVYVHMSIIIEYAELDTTRGKTIEGLQVVMPERRWLCFM